MNIFRVPSWIKRIFKDFIWHINTDEKILFLTFDDGPIPEVTEFVLDTLADYNAKATFFCVGENISKNPEVFKKVIEDGHAFGNHTYNHLKGWQVKDDVYFQNIEKFENQVSQFNSEYLSEVNKPQQTKLLRPPYGRIKGSQAKVLKQKYEIIMWDVLTCDYDRTLSEEDCLKSAIKYSKPGSIVVFHDSIKAQKNLEYVLPKYLKHFSELGYRFERLN